MEECNLTDTVSTWDHLVYLPHQVHEGICGLHLLNSAFSVKFVLRSFSWVYDDHHEDANEDSYDCGHHVVDDSPHAHLPWDSAVQWGHSWDVTQRVCEEAYHLREKKKAWGRFKGYKARAWFGQGAKVSRKHSLQGTEFGVPGWCWYERMWLVVMKKHSIGGS